jgi:hypothetical protein
MQYDMFATVKLNLRKILGILVLKANIGEKLPGYFTAILHH